MKFQRLLASAIVVAIAFLTPMNAADAANWFVSPCGQDFWAGLNPNCVAPLGPKRTVQAAVNAASSGDTIFVLPGTYVGQIDFNGKAVRLESTGGAAATILDGGNTQTVILCNSGEGPNTIIDGFTIRNGFSNNDGGGMLCVFSTPTVQDCVFRHNEAHQGGGMAIFTASPTVINSRFLNNEAVQGAGVFVMGGSPDFEDCEWISNEAQYSGAAMHIASNGNATVIDCKFENNAIGGGGEGSGGGAIALFEADATISGSQFKSNDGSVSGGALYLLGNSASATVTASQMIENTANAGGAISISSVGATVSLVGVTLQWNSAVRGGAISASIGSIVNATLCAFLENHTTVALSLHDGGAIWAHQSHLNLSGCNFFQNSSEGGGGAIAATLSAVTIGGSWFSSNESGENGGALYLLSSDCVINSTNFNGNIAPEQYGGALYRRATSGTVIANDLPDGLTIDDCEFVDSDAEQGGALYLAAGPAQVTNSVFRENHGSAAGGAVSVVGDAIRFRNAQFLDNLSPLAAAMDVTGEASIENSLFRGNHGGYGPAAWVWGAGAKATFVGCRVESNTAGLGGSAMIVMDGGHATALNSIFSLNQSPAGGGTLRQLNWGAGVGVFTIINCVVANNIGGGLVFEDPSSASSVLNSIVWSNGAGGAINGDPRVRRSIVQGGAEGAGNISSNPLFVNAAIGDYRLQAGSPGIDAGGNEHVPADVMDVDADGVTTERFPIDINGDPRFADHETAPDVGCGGAAIVDIGPYEAPGDAVMDVGLADLNGDGVVNGADLATLLTQWGDCDGCCTGDLNGDGEVDGADLAALLTQWG